MYIQNEKITSNSSLAGSWSISQSRFIVYNRRRSLSISFEILLKFCGILFLSRLDNIYSGFLFLLKIFFHFPLFDLIWVNLDFGITVVLRNHIFVFFRMKINGSFGKHQYLLWLAGKQATHEYCCWYRICNKIDKIYFSYVLASDAIFPNYAPTPGPSHDKNVVLTV